MHHQETSRLHKAVTLNEASRRLEQMQNTLFPEDIEALGRQPGLEERAPANRDPAGDIRLLDTFAEPWTVELLKRILKEGQGDLQAIQSVRCFVCRR